MHHYHSLCSRIYIHSLLSLITISNGYIISPNLLNLHESPIYCTGIESQLVFIYNYDDMVKAQSLCGSPDSNSCISEKLYSRTTTNTLRHRTVNDKATPICNDG